MKNLYKKSKIRFALTWIIGYVIGASCTDELSRLVNMEKSITVIFLGVMTAVALLWMKKNDDRRPIPGDYRQQFCAIIAFSTCS